MIPGRRGITDPRPRSRLNNPGVFLRKEMDTEGPKPSQALVPPRDVTFK
jgi:hypothetical protein